MNLTSAQLAQIERICRAHLVAERPLIGSVLSGDAAFLGDVVLKINFDSNHKIHLQ